jgi:hypothetical protein
MFYSRRSYVALIALLSSWTAVATEGTEHNDDARVGADWLRGPRRPSDWFGDEKILKAVPQYVLDYAPLIHLHSKEPFWPGLMDEHLNNTTPYANEDLVEERERNLSLDELGKLNAHLPPWWVFLQSNEEVQKHEFPTWLIGEGNIPVSPKSEGWEDSEEEDFVDIVEDDDWSQWDNVGAPDESAKLLNSIHSASSADDTVPNSPSNNHSPGGRSSAPVVLIVVEKDNGVVDAFWFYFYHYNLGNSVFGIRFGNHVGDWEHNMVRFHNGVPKVVFFSEHAGGASYTYQAVEKIGKRVSFNHQYYLWA